MEIDELIKQIRDELENLLSESYKARYDLTIDSKTIRLAKRFLGEIYPGCTDERIYSLYRVLAEGGWYGDKLKVLLERLDTLTKPANISKDAENKFKERWYEKITKWFINK
ncbi:hypothetical protein [Leptospira sarikeiensis]|uniref:Uncharacterized protein n=1 Tax=Leptospira sarikeiensis TaxID=2484943 RepID=A0A4V3JRW4_9LEPT|nr:hypothetical protein [Leptospira sarikeiensis]TGL62021.1 hypothetical protein EHQ64_09135 [Leptospira sarikeiensis]